MTYRTKTYIAAEWDGDQGAVKKLKEWNDSKHLNLSFTDAHDLTQARDNSLNCSIKSSLAKRFDISKTFVLIVGSNTKSVRNGSCQYCTKYKTTTVNCTSGKSVNYDSYIEYECRKAIKDGLKIVVIHNSAQINRTKCPDIIKNVGEHVTMTYIKDNQYVWNYTAIKNAIC